MIAHSSNEKETMTDQKHFKELKLLVQDAEGTRPASPSEILDAATFLLADLADDLDHGPDKIALGSLELRWIDRNKDLFELVWLDWKGEEVKSRS